MSRPSNQKLSRRIRRVREDAGYGEEVMADRLGIPPATYRNYESGVEIPGPVLLAFVALTRASVVYLLDGTGTRFDLGAIKLGEFG